MNNDISPLIVLRFRDIELNPGETVERHRRIISLNGQCWWGWLWRNHERNPHAELEAYERSLEPAAHHSVVLYDTNRAAVYAAECDQIAAFETPSYSPNVDLTPAYYNNRLAPAWFRLSAIRDADPSMVIGRTCVAMPSATEECFVDLVGKPVTMLRDLRKQEVTMWILQ